MFFASLSDIPLRLFRAELNIERTKPINPDITSSPFVPDAHNLATGVVMVKFLWTVSLIFNHAVD
jgi:hypothetical protein